VECATGRPHHEIFRRCGWVGGEPFTVIRPRALLRLEDELPKSPEEAFRISSIDTRVALANAIAHE
jgi:hypothetical protein